MYSTIGAVVTLIQIFSFLEEVATTRSLALTGHIGLHPP